MARELASRSTAWQALWGKLSSFNLSIAPGGVYGGWWTFLAPGNLKDFSKNWQLGELASLFNSLSSPLGASCHDFAMPDCRKNLGELERIEPSRILNCTSGVHDGARRLFAAENLISSAETEEDCMRERACSPFNSLSSPFGQAELFQSSNRARRRVRRMVDVSCARKSERFQQKPAVWRACIPVHSLSEPFWGKLT